MTDNYNKRYWDLDRNGRILDMSDREIMDAKYPKQNLKQQPDANLHQKISFIKSGVRIVGYAFLPFSLVTATILLISSELIGIIEELV